MTYYISFANIFCMIFVDLAVGRSCLVHNTKIGHVCISISLKIVNKALKKIHEKFGRRLNNFRVIELTQQHLHNCAQLYSNLQQI